MAAVRGADTEVAAAVVETLMAAARDVEVIFIFSVFLIGPAGEFLFSLLVVASLPTISKKYHLAFKLQYQIYFIIVRSQA